MRSTGVVRKLDLLGRLVIPKEIRTKLQMNEGDSAEIYTQDDLIILKKFERGCVFCGESSYDKIEKFKDRVVCVDCKKELMK